MSQPGRPAIPSARDIDREVRTLKEALRVFLSADPKERLRATEWLQSFRRRDDSWDACVAVLGAPRGPGINQVAFQDQLFASQALLYKCRRRVAAITEDDVGSLLRLALGFAREGLRPVLTQLCLGICACAIRHSAWEASKFLPDMVSFCQTASADAGPSDRAPCILILELLTVLPDEATARSGISVSPERRQEFLRTLRDGGESGRIAFSILSKLEETRALPSEGILSAILKCALGWVQLEAVDSGNIFGSSLISLAFSALGSTEACDEACDLLTHVMEAFAEPGVVKGMLSQVTSKRNTLLAAQCEDTCRCLASVFAAAACSYHRCILQPGLASHWRDLLQIMLDILKLPSLEIASLALEFWGLLGQFLSEASVSDGERRLRDLEEAIQRACLEVILRARNPAALERGIAAMDDDAREELDVFRDQAEDLLQTLILPESVNGDVDRVGNGSCDGWALPSNRPSPGFPSEGGARSFDASTSTRARYPYHSFDGKNNKTFSLGGIPTGVNAVADSSRVGVFLSPFQDDLLAWLEKTALECTESALLHERTTPVMGAKETNSPAGVSSPGFPEYNRGVLVCGSPGGAVGNEDGGADWPRVEVLLRLLSAVAKALVLRDVSLAGVGPPVTGTLAPVEVLVEMLPRLPPRRDLQRSAAVLIGESAEWLARRPRVLESALNTLLGAMSLEEEGRGEGEVSMRNKGDDHVGAVALAKLVSFAGPSLASIPNLPKHLLFHYIRFWDQLNQCTLRRLGAAMDNNANRGGGSGGCHPIKEEGEAPALHAGSLRLFLGSLCQILGDSPPTEAAGLSNGAGRGEVMTTEEENGMIGGKGGGGGGVEETGEVLIFLVEAKLRHLERVLDLWRVPAIIPASQVEKNRAMADLASDSLSDLSLVLRKTSPRLNAPGLLARCRGLVEVLVGVVGAFGPGEEERVLPRVCQLFEAIVWSTAEYIRYTAGWGAGASSPEFNINGIGTPPHPVERPNYGNPEGGICRGAEGGMRLSSVLGDFLVNAFVLRPFVRFLEALRCITKELSTFGRLFSPECGDAVPNVSHSACGWVYVAMEKAGTWLLGGVSNIGGGIGGLAGVDAQPEMVEALFRLMTEWIKELPGPSIQWLEAWMHVAVAGLAVRHRGPARAVLGFLQACCLQKDNHFKAAFSSLLTRSGLGVAVTRGLLSAMCGAMPIWMLDDVVTTFRSLFDCFMPATAVSWVDAVLQDPTFERFSASRESKASFSRELKENFCCQEWRAFKNCLKAFCGGKK